LPETLLFDLADDPYEQADLSGDSAEVVAVAESILEDWHHRAMATSTSGVDPLDTILREGDPWHARWIPAEYGARLRKSGRGEWIEKLGNL
jgi:hypothetical protein